jgi:uncharacterized protein with HEPN domain
MLDAAREGIAFCAGQDRTDIRQNRVLTLALAKCIEIVGEAASKVSSETRSEAGSIPWSDIVGMRNRLIHGYFDIDWDLVFDTVTNDLPPLAAMLEGILTRV